jgi:hypothetical protein
VPIVFRHPHLPRINIQANATSLSILPTILDLLVNSNSLGPYDTSVASDLVHEYQGQSLLRPFKSEYKGRQAWNIGIINAGGDMIAVSSAAVSYRLIVPLKSSFEYRFTDLAVDEHETDAFTSWTIEDLLSGVEKKHGKAAMAWAKEADSVAHWWVGEMHRLWNYERNGGEE